MATLVDKIVLLAQTFDQHDVDYAFGGALALAFATAEPRGTRDIDINLFVPASDAGSVFAILPDAVGWSSNDIETALERDQVRIWWGDTPLDFFFDASDFHHRVRARVRHVPFAASEIRVLAASDLAVFKVLFDRSKDWVDIETMIESGGLDIDTAALDLELLLGDDPRIDRLRDLAR